MSLYIRRFTPNGTIKHTKYFCLMAEDDNVTFTITIGSAVTTSDFKYLEYSTDQGNTWTKTNNTGSTKVIITTPPINHGQTVLLRGDGMRMTHGNTSNLNSCTNIIGSGKFNVRGCLMTLLKGGIADETTPITTTSSITGHTFGPLFQNSTNLTLAKDLILPPNITQYCYYNFFNSCSSLTQGPDILYEVLPSYSCGYMFYHCNKLKYIKLMSLDISANNCMTNFNTSVPSTGEFWINPNATWWRTGTNGIPTGWTLFDGTEEEAEEATFIDPEVQRLCISFYGNRNGGTAAVNQRRGSVRIGGVAGKVLKRQIESIINLRSEFSGSSIVDFSDLTKFTRLNAVAQGTGFGFCKCQSLTAITIPNTVTALTSGYTYSNGCFGGCTSLTSLTIPDSVTLVGSSFCSGCTNLKTVRWSSNLKFPTSTNDYYLGTTFAQCTNLETITNPPAPTAITGFRSSDFNRCGKLDFSWLDTTYITMLGPYCFSGCTNLPNELIFPSIASLPYATGGAAKNNFFAGIGRRKVYLPSCTAITSQSFSGNSKALELIDLGNISGSYFYPGRGNSTAQTVTVIMRSTAVPTFSTFTATYIRRLYVYQDILTDFVTQYTAAASITYAIGGTEWQEDFGSSDEWADYPNGQAPVIPT